MVGGVVVEGGEEETGEMYDESIAVLGRDTGERKGDPNDGEKLCPLVVVRPG